MRYLERKTRFISKFTNKYKGIICPSFFVLCWAHRCAFEPRCSYCFLNLTFRYEDEPLCYSNTDKMLEEAKKWLIETKEPSVLNAGELADSFMLKENKALADLMDIFETQDKHKLLFLSKNDELPKELEDNVYSRPYKQTIFSFSLNSQALAERYEKGAPNPFKRIALAYRLKKLSQCIRVRIDPIIEIEDFRVEYQPLVEVLNKFLRPERITLGSLRFFKRLPTFSIEKEIFDKAIDNKDPDNRMRLPLEKRVEIYNWFIEKLADTEISLCKETLDCHLKIKYRKGLARCNCML